MRPDTLLTDLTDADAGRKRKRKPLQPDASGGAAVRVCLCKAPNATAQEEHGMWLLPGAACRVYLKQ